MPNPFDFLTRPLLGLGRKIGQGLSTGVHQLGQYGDEDENDAELSQVRKYLPPGFNGRPNPARQPRPTNGAGNLAQAAGIPDESRAGNYASALGIPDTGGGVLMPANPRPVMPRVASQGEGVRLRPWDAPNEDVPQGQTRPVLIRRPGSEGDDAAPATRPRFANPVNQEPEVAGMDFGISPFRATTAVPELRANGKEKMSRADGGQFNPTDYANDPVERARRGAEMDANFDPRNQSWRGRLKQGLKTGGIAALNSIAQRYQADPRASTGELLGAGAGGFGAGTALGAANPMAAAGLNFDLTQRPKMEADIQRQRQEEARQIELANKRSAIEERRRKVQREGILNTPGGAYDLDSQRVIPGTSRIPAATRPVAPKWEWVTGPDGTPRQVNVNAPGYDPSGYQPYNKPSAENDAGAYREAERMFPQEEADAIAYDSTNARRAEIVSKLPSWAQKALTDPIADPETYKLAKSLFDDEFRRVLEQNKAYTRNVQKQKQLGAAKTARPAKPSTANPTAPRKLSDLERFLR